MKKLLIVCTMLIAMCLTAQVVSPERALRIARSVLASTPESRIERQETLAGDDTVLAYVHHLNPVGYLVISAREELPPLMAFSTTSSFSANESGNLLHELLTADLSSRLNFPPLHQENQRKWNELEHRGGPLRLNGDYLLSTTWNQTQPYNALCPMDPVSNSRSLAGCPAVAMAQILNYLQETHQTRFGDGDDYYHNYSGRNYMIDDDHEVNGFPSFDELNSYLEEVESAFRHDQPLNVTQRAALIFAAGTALKQIYSSQASGTISVNQASNAFLRFGFTNATLIPHDDPDPYSTIATNILDGIPVHLAVVTPAWDMGHNVVVDGINGEGMFHLNFGWGGSYDGWYNLPEGVPYGLSVLEGAVVNLQPQLRIMSMPEVLVLEAGQSQTIEICSLINEPLILEELIFGEGLDSALWQVTPELPSTLDALGILSLSFTFLQPTREVIESSIRLVFDNAWLEIPVRVTVSSPVEDSQFPPPSLDVRVSPNPFRQNCQFLVDDKSSASYSLKIFNFKGQLVHKSSELVWDGKNLSQKDCPSGIYLYRLQRGNFQKLGKLLKL